MTKRKFMAKRESRIKNPVQKNIDDMVNELHAMMKGEAEKDLLISVLKAYDPDYKPLSRQPELFNKASTHFVLANGTKIGSLVELAAAMNDMPDDVFKQHVNQFKHDFSNWAKDSFGREFAEKLKNQRTRKDMKDFISCRLQEQIGLIRR